MASDPTVVGPVGSTRELRARRRPVVPWLVLVLSAAAFCYALPPVRMVRKSSDDAATNRTLNVETTARDVWDGRLRKSLSQAVDAKELLAAIKNDRDAASKKYARRVGVGGSCYYLVTGAGRVVGKTSSRIDLVVAGEAKEPDVAIGTGNIFGNAIRDGTGLFRASDFQNSKDFNQLSEELNKLVETRVLPALRERGAAGAEVRFTGVAEVSDEDLDLKPLRVVPIAAEVR